MPAKTWRGRRLIIDASVLKAAGDTEASSSKACRDFLQVLYDKTRHSVIETPDIKSEWDSHSSIFSTRWLIEMENKDRVSTLDNDLRNEELRAKIEQSSVYQSERQKREQPKLDEDAHEAMLKDAHLVEAALYTDRIIASKDKEARKYFALVTLQIKELKTIVWVDPLIEKELPLTWLKSGAKPEKARQLEAFRKKLLMVQYG